MAAVPVPPSLSGPGSVVAIGDDLGWALGVLFRAYAKATAAALDDVPGGPRGYQVLATSVRNAPGTQLALAHQLGVDRTVMTYLLDDLEKAGLVTRRPDPADRRARRIVATEQGRELVRELDARLCDVEAELLGALPDAEQVTFRALLQRLAGTVNTADPLHNTCQAVEALDS